MSHTEPREQLPASEYVTFGVLSLVLLIATVIASTLGRFLSYAGLETTRSDVAFSVGMGAAVVGPYIIFVAILLTGWALYASGRRAWYVPLAGIVTLVINFNLVAALLGS